VKITLEPAPVVGGEVLDGLACVTTGDHPIDAETDVELFVRKGGV
jgi:hypothetical protein